MSKTVIVKYLVTNQEIEVEIETNKKVSDLKAKIESLFNIKLKNKLMIQKKSKRKPTNLEDENQTIEEAHIHNNDKITIAKTDVSGGL
jgi:phage antirepressor YoqD-like protein